MRGIGRKLALAVGVAALAVGPALAVTVTNQTDKAHEVVVDLGATEPTTTVEPGKSAKLDCPEGCEIRATGLNSYGIGTTAGEKLVIKDGMLRHADAGGSAAAEGGKKKRMTD